MTTTPDLTALSPERTALLAELRSARHFLKFTTRDLTDAQAALTPTPSELCLGGLVKHVTATEKAWADFILDGTSTMKDFDDLTEDDFAARAAEFRMLPGETLAGVIAAYDEVAARTDEVAATADLDQEWPLPKAPWFAETHQTTRRTLLHIIAETAQHAGHADIIREAIDGAQSMA